MNNQSAAEFIESGDIKYVIQAKTPMHACMRALNREATKMRDVRLESNLIYLLKK